MGVYMTGIQCIIFRWRLHRTNKKRIKIDIHTHIYNIGTTWLTATSEK